jgi:hypothetical protein
MRICNYECATERCSDALWSLTLTSAERCVTPLLLSRVLKIGVKADLPFTKPSKHERTGLWIVPTQQG